MTFFVQRTLLATTDKITASSLPVVIVVNGAKKTTLLVYFVLSARDAGQLLIATTWLAATLIISTLTEANLLVPANQLLAPTASRTTLRLTLIAVAQCARRSVLSPRVALKTLTARTTTATAASAVSRSS